MRGDRTHSYKGLKRNIEKVRIKLRWWRGGQSRRGSMGKNKSLKTFGKDTETYYCRKFIYMYKKS